MELQDIPRKVSTQISRTVPALALSVLLRAILALAIAVVLASALAPSFAHATSQMPPDLIRRVDLNWEPDDSAISYEFQLGLSADFSNNLFDEKLKDTKFTIDLLPGTYFYRIRAVDEQERPGRWTPVQELNINARPPIPLWPPDDTVFEGNLPDNGIELTWRPSGPSIRYLVEIKGEDEAGNLTRTVVKQEVEDTTFAYFPTGLGKYSWQVYTLGSAGAEPGSVWDFDVLGSPPREGDPNTRVVRFVPPWWRGHWTLFSRYGQAALSYSIFDHDFRSESDFIGLTGYVGATLNWEWHDPIRWRVASLSIPLGIPWWEVEYELDRQTVLQESVVLPRYHARAGTWFENIIKNWRFSPLVEFGAKQVGIYQPQSPVTAYRTNTRRWRIGVGPAAEYKLLPFLALGSSVKAHFEWGGIGGVKSVGGVVDMDYRPYKIHTRNGWELVGSGTLALSPRMSVQGRLRFETNPQSWRGLNPSQTDTGTCASEYCAGPNTEITMHNSSFDVSFGYKF